jgi:hypothetical protein
VRESRDPDPMSQLTVRHESAVTRDNGPLSLLGLAAIFAVLMAGTNSQRLSGSWSWAPRYPQAAPAKGDGFLEGGGRVLPPG